MDIQNATTKTDLHDGVTDTREDVLIPAGTPVTVEQMVEGDFEIVAYIGGEKVWTYIGDTEDHDEDVETLHRVVNF